MSRQIIYLRVSSAMAMHEIIKDIKNDEVDYYLPQSQSSSNA